MSKPKQRVHIFEWPAGSGQKMKLADIARQESVSYDRLRQKIVYRGMGIAEAVKTVKKAETRFVSQEQGVPAMNWNMALSNEYLAKPLTGQQAR